jgi:hypothetical protein
VIEVVVQNIAALVPQTTFLDFSVNGRLNVGAVQVVTSVSVNIIKVNRRRRFMQCALLVDAWRNHDLLREFEQRDVREQAVALRDGANGVIQANVWKQR